MDFMNKIPRGKDDKPFLLIQGMEIIYDIDDIDGQLAMLDRTFSGCVAIAFTKSMNPDTPGIVLLNGQEVQYCLKPLAITRGLWMLGARVAGMIDAYNATYILHIEGFTDADGNKMLPADVRLHTKERNKPLPENARHETIALQAAEEGIVLLKNEHMTLPIPPGTLNIFGTGINQFRTGVIGAGKINPRYVINLKEAIRDSSEYQLNETLIKYYSSGQELLPNDIILEEARQLSDVAFVLLTRTSGENLDNSSARGEYYLTADEDTLIQKLAHTFRHTAVILNVPYPIDVTFAEKYNVDALVYSGIGGMLGGQALLNVLSGKVNPSGKLPDTWAKDYFDIPSSKNFYDCAKDGPRLDADTDIWLDTVYEEDIYVGYRYFDTFGKEPAYPFGHGLSYTTFEINKDEFSFDKSEGIRCTVSVTNTGQVPGKEVIQLYIGKPDGKLEHPNKELVGFEKTKLLDQGEKQVLKFLIPLKHLTSYEEAEAAYVMMDGTYHVYMGTSAANTHDIGTFALQNTLVIKQVKNRMVPLKRPKTLSKYQRETSYPTGSGSLVKKNVHKIEPPRLVNPFLLNGKPLIASETISFHDVILNPELAEVFAAQLTVEELSRITVCASSGWGMQDTGVAGHLARLEKYDIPELDVSDGNCSVNVSTPNIGLPTTVSCCASFNKKLMYEIGKVLGEEAQALNISLMLVPAMNIHRNPLNGRHPEYFSEDPYLTGIMAGTYCAGLESTGVAGCYKHCIANNCESSRKRNQSIITERAIREIYFRAFELALEVHKPYSIMTAYNAVNGIHTAADNELIEGLFREENGFDGFVMTDWNTYDTCDIVEMIKGGNNWITPGSTDDKYTRPLVEAVANGSLPIASLQQSVSRLIKTVARIQSFKKIPRAQE